MRARDVLPPGAPLLLNTCRPARPEREAANLELMRFYLHRRLDAMPPEVRMVVNVDDPRLMMGAVLGLEFATAFQESRKPAPAPEVEAAPEPERKVEAEAPAAAVEAVWLSRTRKAPALAVVLSRTGDKVTCRQYVLSSDSWTGPGTIPASRVMGPASPASDVEAGNKRRPVGQALAKLDAPVVPSNAKPVWLRRGGDKRGGKTLAVVLSNGGPDAFVTKFSAIPRRWSARSKVPCARILGPADPSEKVTTSAHGTLLRVADAMALYH